MMVSIFYLLICTPGFVVIVVVVVAFMNARFSVRQLQADNLPWAQ